MLLFAADQIFIALSNLNTTSFISLNGQFEGSQLHGPLP